MKRVLPPPVVPTTCMCSSLARTERHIGHLAPSRPRTIAVRSTAGMIRGRSVGCSCGYAPVLQREGLTLLRLSYSCARLLLAYQGALDCTVDRCGIGAVGAQLVTCRVQFIETQFVSPLLTLIP